MNNSSNLDVPYWRLSSFYFFYFAVVGCMVPYWGLYLQSLGYSAFDIGVMGAAILATRIVAPNFWGWIADKRQHRLRIIHIGSALAVLSFSGALFITDYAWLLVVIALYTFFCHAVLPQFEVITLGYLQGKTERYSRIRLWGSVGFIVAVVVLGFVFDRLGIAYLPSILFNLLVLIMLSGLPLKEPVSTVRKGVSSHFLTLITRPYMLAFFAASILLQFSHGPYYTFFTLYLVDGYGYSQSVAGALWALGVIAEVVIFIAMPNVLTRFRLTHLLTGVFLVTSLRWGMIGVGAEWLGVIVIGQLLHAVSFGVAHAVSIEIVRRELGASHASQGQALYSSLSFGVGGALGALMGGIFWDTNPQLTFLIASGASLLAAVICYMYVNDRQG
jgi:PPP family 3-phenylpropionic acid transporter